MTTLKYIANYTSNRNCLLYAEDTWRLVIEKDSDNTVWLIHICRPDVEHTTHTNFRFHISTVTACRGCSAPSPIIIQTLMALMTGRVGF